MKNRIIVPTDFTEAANQAIRQAIVIARQTGSSVTLFHVIDHKSDSAAEASRTLNSQVEDIIRDSGIACKALLREGSIFDIIPLAVVEKDYDLMVIGTHGIKGLRQMVFGADILKLISRIEIPVLVIQEKSPLVESFKKIIFPVGSHDNFNLAVEAGLLFAGWYPNLEIHLYSIHKPGFEWSRQLLDNIGETTMQLEKHGARMIRIKEDQEGFSAGYASQTITYAASVGADAILIMSSASEEFHYMAKTYKESVLLNESHIPVICAGGGDTL
jgi:nucleotide-binding universal stress UspA family protein